MKRCGSACDADVRDAIVRKEFVADEWVLEVPLLSFGKDDLPRGAIHESVGESNE